MEFERGILSRSGTQRDRRHAEGCGIRYSEALRTGVLADPPTPAPPSPRRHDADLHPRLRRFRCLLDRRHPDRQGRSPRRGRPPARPLTQRNPQHRLSGSVRLTRSRSWLYCKRRDQVLIMTAISLDWGDTGGMTDLPSRVTIVPPPSLSGGRLPSALPARGRHPRQAWRIR